MTDLGQIFISRIREKISRLSSSRAIKIPNTGWYETEIDGLKWRLDLRDQIDREVALQVFEIKTTELIKKVIKPGMNILDIGANIGYYSTLMGKLIGEHGKLWAFEPVEKFRDQNIWHIQANHLQDQVQILGIALSDTKKTTEINVDQISATMHRHSLPGESNSYIESIQLDTLDHFDQSLSLPRIDFMKIDTDGHEPFIFKGATDFFLKQKPILMVEFAQLALDAAGSDVRELKEVIESLGYILFSEKTLLPFNSRTAFLLECGNFTHSANVWAVHDQSIRSLSEIF